MEYTLVGWPREHPVLKLPHERFAYAGKFVMTNTGKATAREGESVVAAAAFNRDRTDERTWWIRYLTVRTDRRGEGIGSRLAADLADRLLDDSGDRVRIAVNNPFAYEALHKAGFGFTGERTGVAELVLERPAVDRAAGYRAGWEVFAGRDDLSPMERDYVSAKRSASPPSVIG